MGQDKIAKALQEHVTLLQEAFQRQANELAGFAKRVVDVFHQGGHLFVLGSGSLGAIANLVANLFLHRLSLERPSLPALSLCHDVTLATALARNRQERQFFAQQLKVMAGAGDVVLAFGDAYRDEALEEALDTARQIGCVTAALTQGKGEMAGEPPDFLFHLETDSTPRAVEGVLFFGHLLCELAEEELFGI
jgi:D-sedoheptulose 7-phosphate isomerase